jgi:hydrogenase expression/formation protein HypE
LFEEKLPIREETKAICEALEIDPLKLLSSGSLLMSVAFDKSDDVVQKLKSIGVESSVIGEISTSGKIIVSVDGVEREAGEVEQDELFRVLESE